MQADRQIIYLHADAPEKPPAGQPCNGCGVCCSVETCPVGRLRFLRRHGPCPALQWVGDAGAYRCGLVHQPDDWLPLPAWAVGPLRRWLVRAIAAGKGCDATVETEPLRPNPPQDCE